MNLQRQAVGAFLLLIAFVVAPLSIDQKAASAEEGSQAVAIGKRVSIEYSVSLPDKKEVDTNVGREPLTYTQGSADILPAVQAAILGVKLGETKVFTLKPEEAYGAVNSNAFLEVNKSQIPENLREPGKELVGRGPSGTPQRFRVHEVKAETVILDFNHPLAGKTLTFTIKVTKIE
ncbi:MAG: peptidylprolyl isomerase [Nitrospinota bacterium]